jgi:hypothetical protein
VTIFLRNSGDLPDLPAYDRWIALAGAPAADPASGEIENAPALLEDAFNDIAGDWLAFAREIGGTPTATLSHLPACAANISDFGEMLAWSRIVEKLADDPDLRVLAICDDPWLFRHLSDSGHVTAGKPPRFSVRRISLFVRGYAARIKYSIRAAADSLLLRGQRLNAKPGGAWLLVYGHPKSDPAGYDGYFGELPELIPEATRILHVDCERSRIRELAQQGRVVSLRAWGAPLAAILLPFKCWRPDRRVRNGKYGWLVRRASTLEGGTAQAAALFWQTLCQYAWLAENRPSAVAWPWENHSWERAFVRRARTLDIYTLGYQHSVIGPQMLNYSLQSCSDGLACMPDVILCTGQSTLKQLVAWNIPDNRLAIGGALRFPQALGVRYDSQGPVFVALPFDHGTAAEMLSAIADCAQIGRQFVIRDHPMSPFDIRPGGHIRNATGPLGDQLAVSAVLYAATTVGLEALMAGLPTLRFRARSCLALNILPSGVDVPTADLHSLPQALLDLQPAPPVNRESVFAVPDTEIWRLHLKVA